MLIVHPSSRCDVCLDGYNWTSQENAPYAIYCGHIFCKTCLATLSPSSCPLCRKPFSLDKVKRLIVDRISPSDPSLGPSRNGAAGGGGNGLLDESTTLLEQIALVSGEDTPIEQAMQVLGGAKQWLDVQPANVNTHRALKAAVSALSRYKDLQAEHAKTRNDYKTLRHHYKKKTRAWDQDKIVWASSESRLMQERDEALARIEKLEARMAVLQGKVGKPDLGLGLVNGFNGFNGSTDKLGLGSGSTKVKHIDEEDDDPKAKLKQQQYNHVASTYRSPITSDSGTDDEASEAPKKRPHHRNTTHQSHQSHHSNVITSASAPPIANTSSNPLPPPPEPITEARLSEMDRSRSLMTGRASNAGNAGSAVHTADSSFASEPSVGDLSFSSSHSKMSTSSSISTHKTDTTTTTSSSSNRTREPSSSSSGPNSGPSSAGPSSMASSFTSNGMHHPQMGQMPIQVQNVQGLPTMPNTVMNEQSLQLVDKWLQRTGLPMPEHMGGRDRDREESNGTSAGTGNGTGNGTGLSTAGGRKVKSHGNTPPPGAPSIGSLNGGGSGSGNNSTIVNGTNGSAQQPALEQPKARTAGESAVPTWAQPSGATLQRRATSSRRAKHAASSSTSTMPTVAERPSGDRRVASDEIVPRIDSRGSNRGAGGGSARNSSGTPPVSGLGAHSHLQGQGLGMLGLYSEPSHGPVQPSRRARDDSSALGLGLSLGSGSGAGRRGSRRARNGSMTDTEGSAPVHRAHARVQATGMTRENSAPTARASGGASTGSATGSGTLQNMGSFSDLSLVGLPGAPTGPGTIPASSGARVSPPTGRQTRSSRSSPVQALTLAAPSSNTTITGPTAMTSAAVRERPGVREAPPRARPDSTSSVSSWGTMATPSPRPHLSDLGLDDLLQVRTPVHQAQPQREQQRQANAATTTTAAISANQPTRAPRQAPQDLPPSTPGPEDQQQQQRQQMHAGMRTPGPRVARMLAASALAEDEEATTPRNAARGEEDLAPLLGTMVHSNSPGHGSGAGTSPSSGNGGLGLGLGLSLSPPQLSPPVSVQSSRRTSPTSVAPPPSADAQRPQLVQRSTLQSVPHAGHVHQPVADQRPGATRSATQVQVPALGLGPAAQTGQGRVRTPPQLQSQGQGRTRTPPQAQGRTRTPPSQPQSTANPPSAPPSAGVAAGPTAAPSVLHPAAAQQQYAAYFAQLQAQQVQQAQQAQQTQSPPVVPPGGLNQVRSQSQVPPGQQQPQQQHQQQHQQQQPQQMAAPVIQPMHSMQPMQPMQSMPAAPPRQQRRHTINPTPILYAAAPMVYPQPHQQYMHAQAAQPQPRPHAHAIPGQPGQIGQTGQMGQQRAMHPPAGFVPVGPVPVGGVPVPPMMTPWSVPAQMGGSHTPYAAPPQLGPRN